MAWNATDRPAGTIPHGVAILAVLIGLVGVLFLAGSLLVLRLTTFAFSETLGLSGLGILGGILLLIVAIVLLVVAVGLWRLDWWALVRSILVGSVLLLNALVRGAVLSVRTVLLALMPLYLVLVRRPFA